MGAAGPGSHPPAASIVDAHRFGEAADAPSPRRPLRPSARPSVRTRPGPLNPEKRESRVQSAQKFKARYATFGFSDNANLDEGAMWPTSFALKELTAAEEKKIGALVKKAVR